MIPFLKKSLVKLETFFIRFAFEINIIGYAQSYKASYFYIMGRIGTIGKRRKEVYITEKFSFSLIYSKIDKIAC